MPTTACIQTRSHLHSWFGACRAVTTSDAAGAKRTRNPLRIVLVTCALSFVLAFVLPLSHADKAQPAQPRFLHLKIGPGIEPVPATYLAEGIDEATRRNASLILITMD